METSERSASKVLVFVSVIGLTIVGSVQAQETSPIVPPQLKEYRIVRSVSEDAQKCIDCHAIESKGIVADWAASRHGHANISCLD
ncbi:MAG: multiheme c-type cytochrome, partial [Planctomycetota bacterium]